MNDPLLAHRHRDDRPATSASLCVKVGQVAEARDPISDHLELVDELGQRLLGEREVPREIACCDEDRQIRAPLHEGLVEVRVEVAMCDLEPLLGGGLIEIGPREDLERRIQPYKASGYAMARCEEDPAGLGGPGARTPPAPPSAPARGVKSARHGDTQRKTTQPSPPMPSPEKLSPAAAPGMPLLTPRQLL
jgi:hypothetical protein